MILSSQKLKEKMLELTQLFCIERNIFQKFVIIYKYITLLNTKPLTKDILQKKFDETAKIMGCFQKNCMNEKKFLDVKGEIIYSHDFWMYYSNLEVVHGKMKEIKKCEVADKKDFEKLCLLFSEPYSQKMLELSFEIINSNIFDSLDHNSFIKESKLEGKTYFDPKKGIIFIKGIKIYVDKQNKITNAHKILNHIFIRNKKSINDDFFYSEIAIDEFSELEYKTRKNNWRKYHTACEDIDSKVEKQSNGKIKNFLIFNTGSKGKTKINKKYL